MKHILIALGATIAITCIVIAAILAIAGLGYPIEFATILSGLAIGLVTVIFKFWPFGNG